MSGDEELTQLPGGKPARDDVRGEPVDGAVGGVGVAAQHTANASVASSCRARLTMPVDIQTRILAEAAPMLGAGSPRPPHRWLPTPDAAKHG
jgi:hypothetical protein